MKKFAIVIAFAAICAIANAIPASPYSATIAQPDGTTVTVQLHGDEFMHFTTTADGYTVVKDEAGFYVYASADESGALVATQQIAHDADARSQAERAFLRTIRPYLTDSDAGNSAASARKSHNALIKSVRDKAASHRAMRPKAHGNSPIRALVLLVQFNDRQFSRSDINAVFTDLFNMENYPGVPDQSNPGNIIDPYCGSIHDYFSDNSMGLINLQFDVAGPFTIDYSQTDAHGTSNADKMVKDAVTIADKTVDFSLYDNYGYGVDYLFVVFAGHGSNTTSNNSDLIWPHMSYIGMTVDGGESYIETYACTAELRGKESTNKLLGIGSVCHELSHTFGLLDEYDTDYSGSGGQSTTPGVWSLMDSGCYLDDERTPTGYSLFERYWLDLATPKPLTADSSYTLGNLAETNTGYILTPGYYDEFFLFENRRRTKWDKFLPGEGMLAYHVDMTDMYVWYYNEANTDPMHNYYRLIRARSNGNAAGDPFPGTTGATVLSCYSSPALKPWYTDKSPLMLRNIAETETGEISFETIFDNYASATEDFEAMPTFDGEATASGKFADWRFSGVELAERTRQCNGVKSLKLKNGSSIETTSSVWADEIVSLSFCAWNSTTKSVQAHVFISADEGNSWSEIFPQGQDTPLAIKGGRSGTATSFPISSGEHIIFRITTEAASEKTVCYIDDVTLNYNDAKGLSAVETIVPDRKTPGMSISIDGLCITVSTPDYRNPIEIFDTAGRLVATAPASAVPTTLALPKRGFYIVRQSASTLKLAL